MSRTRAVALVLLVAAAACAPATRREAPPSAVPAEGAPRTLVAAAGVRYALLPERSELRVLVYRAGALARLGHNHVLVNRGLAGEVRLPADRGAVTFDVVVPVAAFAVDEPAERRAEGPDFASEPRAEEVAGTVRNLRSAAVLDAEAWPDVRLVGRGARGGPVDYTVRVEVGLRGVATAVEVPAHVTLESGMLTAVGELRLPQTSLGLTPFSVALGALQVADEVTIRYRLVAAVVP